jgi:hypothetical protein
MTNGDLDPKSGLAAQGDLTTQAGATWVPLRHRCDSLVTGTEHLTP